MKTIQATNETLLKILPPQKPVPGTEYVPSQFAFPFEHGGRHYVYHTLTKQCVEGELPRSLRPEDDADGWIRSYFFVPAGKDECAFYESVSAVMQALTRKKESREFTILPTLACNARCVYCYEEGMEPVTMTPEVIGRTVEFIRENSGGLPVRLGWFGGEPLLRPDIIDRICAGLRDAGVAYGSGMISNASLITPEIVAKMTGEWKLSHIQISMDGAERDYVLRKRYRTYRDDYHAVMAHINDLTAAGIGVTVRCNVDEENLPGVPAFLEDLKNAIRERDQVTVYFCPLNHVRAGDRCGDVWRKCVNFRAQIEQAGFRNSGFNGTGTRFRVTHCMADANGVVIAPDGRLYPCEHCPPGSSYGDVFRGVTDEAVRAAFRTVGPTREKCRGCVFLPECTSFSVCPIRDTHCRDVRRMSDLEVLKKLAERQADAEKASEDAPIC